jgi:hypothetical protein
MPPKNSKARMCEPHQSGKVCDQVASAQVKLDAPSTATKICAVLKRPRYIIVPAFILRHVPIPSFGNHKAKASTADGLRRVKGDSHRISTEGVADFLGRYIQTRAPRESHSRKRIAEDRPGCRYRFWGNHVLLQRCRGIEAAKPSRRELLRHSGQGTWGA